MSNGIIDLINDGIKLYKKDGNSVKQISDTHHTFEELYFQRMVLTKIIAESYPKNSWKSKLHDDGTMFDGDFIVGFTTPKGQYTYHYKLKYWNYFDIKALKKAPKYDGHKPNDIERLVSLLKTKGDMNND